MPWMLISSMIDHIFHFQSHLQMVLSSDKLSGLGKPILQLKLDTAVESNATTSGIQEHLVELDAKELDYLLNSLKAARAVIYKLFST